MTRFFAFLTLLALAQSGLYASERKYTKDVAKLAAAPTPAASEPLVTKPSLRPRPKQQPTLPALD